MGALIIVVLIAVAVWWVFHASAGTTTRSEHARSAHTSESRDARLAEVATAPQVRIGVNQVSGRSQNLKSWEADLSAMRLIEDSIFDVQGITRSYALHRLDENSAGQWFTKADLERGYGEVENSQSRSAVEAATDLFEAGTPEYDLAILEASSWQAATVEESLFLESQLRRWLAVHALLKRELPRLRVPSDEVVLSSVAALRAAHDRAYPAQEKSDAVRRADAARRTDEQLFLFRRSTSGDLLRFVLEELERRGLVEQLPLGTIAPPQAFREQAASSVLELMTDPIGEAWISRPVGGAAGPCYESFRADIEHMTLRHQWLDLGVFASERTLALHRIADADEAAGS